MKGKHYRLLNEADDQGGQGGSGNESNVKFENFTKEMDKKLGSVTNAVDALLKSQNALVNQLAQTQQKSQPKDDDSDSDSHLLYSNPAEWAKKKEKEIESKVENKVLSKIQSQNEQQAKTTQVLQGLMAEYPELSNVDSALAKKAIEKFESLPENERSSTLAYKVAVKEAAEELAIQPKSKRKSADDDFSLGQSGYNGDRQRSPKITQETIEFAKIMGLDVEDKKVLERLSKHAKRDFSRYQQS